MKYIDALKGTGIAVIIFSLASFLVPQFEKREGVEVILSISTFLFAIIAGFFISRLNSRYDGMRNIVSQEDAYLLAFFKTSELFGESFKKHVRELIDQYYIINYDHALSQYAYKETAPYYFQMWEALRKIKNREPQSAYQVLVNQLTEVEKLRNSAATLAVERMSAGQWIILVALAIIILISLFAFQSSSFYSHLVTVLLSSSLVLILLIIRDLQNLMFTGKGLLEESGEEVLEYIGKPRYYNEYFVKIGVSKIPQHLTTYRLGRHAPGSTDLKIDLISRGKSNS